MPDIIFSPSDFVAVLNQTLEYAYPTVAIEGELANFKVSKSRWVYFDLKDELASVRFFGTVYNLPGPLEDGLLVRVTGSPRLHARFGFSVSVQTISPVGEGSLKKAAELLRRKLEAEGLFAPERKRPLPEVPVRVGLITAADSAARADFEKILNEKWGGVTVLLADVYVQGEQAPLQLVQAIEHINKLSMPPEVLVLTRGGGSPEDLAAFSDERVVRAVAASRIPTLVAIGHEVDISLAELAADMRASTPSNAAALLVPDRAHELAVLEGQKIGLARAALSLFEAAAGQLEQLKADLKSRLSHLLLLEAEKLAAQARLAGLLDPKAALKRGYALVKKDGKLVRSIRSVKPKDLLAVQLHDGTIRSKAMQVISDAKKP